MKLFTPTFLMLLSLGLILPARSVSSQDSALGLFEEHRDIGAVRRPGSVEYDAARNSYLVAGGGENMWSTSDAFHFVWKRMPGDVSLAADIRWVGAGGHPHRKNALERAVFEHVELTSGRPQAAGQPVLESTLETVAIASKDRRVVYHARAHFEAPNWSRDGKYFLFNQGGRIYKLPAAGGQPQLLNTGFAVRCNNDHGISPDGTQLAISDQSQEQRRSLIYILPIAGGIPRRVTRLASSYWHGWSPDGKRLAYCGERNGEFDIYTIPVEGGDEKRLTTAPGLDDGPDYSPDGQYIYFNSERTGRMQIWRMRTDGSDQQQVTSDEYNDWFPHPSPDGKWIVFLSYEKDVKGHPPNQDVMLRLMPMGGGEIQVLAKLFGGQGTINVPSWSPDSRHLAFVSYRLTKP
jgi:Tol biopolymer transport system component